MKFLANQVPRYLVRLTETERQEPEDLSTRGRPAATTATRARILLKADGAQEARLIALAYGPAPEGRTRWTLKLLAQRLVEPEVVPSLSAECVRTTLKKASSSPG